MCGRDVVCSDAVAMGILHRISCSPSQPNDVCSDGRATAGFCRDGALPIKAALIAEKSYLVSCSVMLESRFP